MMIIYIIYLFYIIELLFGVSIIKCVTSKWDSNASALKYNIQKKSKEMKKIALFLNSMCKCCIPHDSGE